MTTSTLATIAAAAVLVVACGPTAGSDHVDDGAGTSDGTSDGVDAPDPSTTTGGHGTTGADPTDADFPSDPPDFGDLGGQEPTPSCACEELPQDGFDPGCSYESLQEYGPACDLPVLCDEVWVECSRPGYDLYTCETEWTYAQDAQICALQALRDRVPGVLHIQGTNDLGIFSSTDLNVVRILDRGGLTINSCMGTDVGAYWFPTTGQAIADSSYYAGCLAAPDAAARHECLLGGLQGTVVELPACE